MLKNPSKLAFDPNYRKLVYVRYADDWLIGVRGSREDCRYLLEKVRTFLDSELKITLSHTLITNVSESASFLGTVIGRSKVQAFQKTQSGPRPAPSQILRGVFIVQPSLSLSEREKFVFTACKKREGCIPPSQGGRFAIRINKELILTAPILRVLKKLEKASFIKGNISNPKMH